MMKIEQCQHRLNLCNEMGFPFAGHVRYVSEDKSLSWTRPEDYCVFSFHGSAEFDAGVIKIFSQIAPEEMFLVHLLLSWKGAQWTLTRSVAKLTLALQLWSQRKASGTHLASGYSPCH